MPAPPRRRPAWRRGSRPPPPPPPPGRPASPGSWWASPTAPCAPSPSISSARSRCCRRCRRGRSRWPRAASATLSTWRCCSTAASTRCWWANRCCSPRTRPPSCARCSAAATAPRPEMVKVKICGVADVASALLSAELGADYLGLNFWPGSPRFVDLPRARDIAAAVRRAAPGVELVGVFVNPAAAAVEEAAAAAGLDLLQFSGDETPAAVRPFAARAIKALRTHDAAAVAAFAECWGLLLDTPRSGGGAPAYGGTGRPWEYGAAAAAIAGASRRPPTRASTGPPPRPPAPTPPLFVPRRP